MAEEARGGEQSQKECRFMMHETFTKLIMARSTGRVCDLTVLLFIASRSEPF
jgi:hypothetical protein